MLTAISITPPGVHTSREVAEAVRVIRASGLPHETYAMFTLIEGEWDEVMPVIKQAVDAVLALGVQRCKVDIKMDIQPGVTDALVGKVQAVNRRLER